MEAPNIIDLENVIFADDDSDIPYDDDDDPEMEETPAVIRARELAKSTTWTTLSKTVFNYEYFSSHISACFDRTNCISY